MSLCKGYREPESLGFHSWDQISKEPHSNHLDFHSGILSAKLLKLILHRSTIAAKLTATNITGIAKIHSTVIVIGN